MCSRLNTTLRVTACSKSTTKILKYVVQVSFLLTLSRYVVMWQIFFTLYATWIHAPKLNLTKKTWVQICFKPLYKKWNFPLKISSVNEKLHFFVQCYKAMSKLFLLLIHFRLMLLFVNPIKTLREKCPNTEFFLVRIFPDLDWIRRDTEYLSVFSPNPEKYGPEKTPYLDTFHVMRPSDIFLIFSGNIEKEHW